jgi:hypothetical protein
MSVTKKELENIIDDLDTTIQRASRGSDALLIEGATTKAIFYIALMLCDIRDNMAGSRLDASAKRLAESWADAKNK